MRKLLILMLMVAQSTLLLPEVFSAGPFRERANRRAASRAKIVRSGVVRPVPPPPIDPLDFEMYFCTLEQDCIDGMTSEKSPVRATEMGFSRADAKANAVQRLQDACSATGGVLDPLDPPQCIDCVNFDGDSVGCDDLAPPEFSAPSVRKVCAYQFSLDVTFCDGFSMCLPIPDESCCLARQRAHRIAAAIGASHGGIRCVRHRGCRIVHI
jgi:hypothetical protein